MAKQTVNIGSTANDGTGDQLRTAFNKLNQNFDEVYGTNFVTELMLNDNIVGAAELKVTGNGNVGQLLSSDGDGTMTWANAASGRYTTEIVGASTTVSAVKDYLYILANPLTVTITLPASPADGDTIGIANNFVLSGGNITNQLVAPGTGGNTGLIMGAIAPNGTPFVIDNGSAAFDLVFSSAGAPTGNGWTIVGAN